MEKNDVIKIVRNINNLFLDNKITFLVRLWSVIFFPFLSQPINSTRVYVAVIASRTQKGKSL